jgi:hypothetical protein
MKKKIKVDLKVHKTGHPDAWYYREAKHFDVHVYVHAASGLIINFRIPYSKVPKP